MPRGVGSRWTPWRFNSRSAKAESGIEDFSQPLADPANAVRRPARRETDASAFADCVKPREAVETLKSAVRFVYGSSVLATPFVFSAVLSRRQFA
jgi:hypothetical protein